MNEIRNIIVEEISRMLDNPDKYGIYQTGMCYDNLEYKINDYINNQLQSYKDKEEKTKQIFINLLFKLGELNKQYKDNKSDDYGIRTQDYLELYKILNEGDK